MTTEEIDQPDGEATFSHQIESPDSGEKREKIVAANLERLVQRRERGEIAAESFHFYDIYDLGNPILTREIVGNRAIVLTQEDLENLGGIEMQLDSGDVLFLDPEMTGYGPDEQIIIWPEDLG